MKLRKSNLDEQQERRLLEIESRGCWLAFWGLLLALIVESVVIKDSRAIIGEWILFMGLALYLAISCTRAGIWDRRMDMSRKTCLLFSLAAGICAGLFLFAFTFARYQKPIGSLCAGAIGVVPRGTSHKKAPGRTQRRAGGRGFSVICLTMKLISRQQKKAAFTIF